jgi:DNA invertase Pin-like site-specific DNA recombinase
MNPLPLSARRPRVALYARVSTVDQHPQTQIHALRQLAEQRGWEIVGEYVDHGVSGSRDRRPQLDALMKHVSRGGVDIVGVWRFDRFARSVRHLVVALDDLRARGVDFVSVNDSIDTSTPSGRFTFAVIAAVAELEREIIRERTRAGLAEARRRGAKVGRPRAVIDITEARRLLANGASLRGAARTLKVGASTLARALQGDDGTDPETCVSPSTSAA